jgi:hypothetical protein
LSIASTIEDAGVALDPVAVLEIAHATAGRLGPVIAAALTQSLASATTHPSYTP